MTSPQASGDIQRLLEELANAYVVPNVLTETRLDSMHNVYAAFPDILEHIRSQDEKIAVLKKAIKTAIPMIPTDMDCHGYKCRLAVCEACCCGEERAHEVQSEAEEFVKYLSSLTIR